MFTMNMRALGTSEQLCVKFLLKQAKQANLTEGDRIDSYLYSIVAALRSGVTKVGVTRGGN